MFKTLSLFRFANLNPCAPALAEDGHELEFTPCAPTQLLSIGWIPPRGVEHGALIEAQGVHLVLRARVQTKAVPAAQVADAVEKMATQIEQTTGRKPGKKQLRELKDQAILELLPLAFPKTQDVYCWFDQETGILAMSCTTGSRTDLITSLLAKTFAGLELVPFQTQLAPATAMALWLQSGQPPAGFSVDRDCELKSADEMKSVVRYSRHALDLDQVREHIALGKQPTRLALTWGDRVSMVLTADLKVKAIDFLDVVFVENRAQADGEGTEFDADMAISTGELRPMIRDLVDALDGELLPGALPAAASEQGGDQ